MANVPQPAEGVTTAVPPAPPAPDAAEPYRPMSGLAMTGFALAALFAASVLIGGVIALLTRSPRTVLALLVLAPLGGLIAAALARKPGGQMGRWAGLALLGLLTALGLGGLIAAVAWGNPWDLPPAFWALPLAAGLVCWMALSAIARSEGTLDGAGLARWGLRLSLFFALIYGCYSVANILAVRGQSKQAAADFLNEIAKGGDLYPAYLHSKAPASRPTSGARDLIEAENRTGPSSTSGPFSRFKEADFVRLIALAGGKNDFKQLSVGWPEFKNGSYYVLQIFRVTNPLATFEVEVMTRSVDRPEPDGTKRRSWFIELPSCKVRVTVERDGQPRPALTLTADGQQLESRFQAAQAVAARWLERTGSGPRGLALFDTLAPADRAALTEAWVAEAGWNAFVRAMAFSPWLLLPASERFLEARAGYERGELLHTDDLWAVREVRDLALESARRMFRTQPMPQPFSITLVPTRLPTSYRAEDGKALIGVPVRGMVTPHQIDHPQMALMKAVILEGEVVIEAPAADDPAAMRVKQFRATRAQSASGAEAGGMGGMGMPEG